MIEKQLKTLQDLRDGAIDISEFYYKKELDNKGHAFDANENKRYQLLIALQYARVASNEWILKELFEQEIKMHQKAPFQGITASIQLNACLLSEFSNPAYIWLFMDAKEANFDMHCGFDYQYLVFAGIEESFDYIAQSTNTRKETFYEYVGETRENCYISEVSFEEWREKLRDWYPAVLELETLEEKMDMAMDLEDDEAFCELFAAWKKEQAEWTKESLESLAYYEGVIGNVEGQIWASEAIYDLELKDWDKAAYLRTISKLYLQINEGEKAWEKLQLVQELVEKMPSLKNVGLGREILENTFEIVLFFADAENEIAKAAYSWAIQKVQALPTARKNGFHLNLLKKIASSAELMGELEVQTAFLEILRIKDEQWQRIINA